MAGGRPSPWSRTQAEHTAAEDGLNSGHLPLAQELQFFRAQVFPAELAAAPLPFSLCIGGAPRPIWGSLCPPREPSVAPLMTFQSQRL